MTPVEEKLFSIFFPYASDKQSDMQKKQLPLVHYTSAEAARSIITNRKLWMRESSCMNDSSEVSHGLKCVVLAYKSNAGEKLKTALNNLSPVIRDGVEKHFDSWAPHFPLDTYLACFSEHDEKKEGSLGRLSMWRAYSKKTGVALVLNSKVFFEESEYFEGLYTSPVAYLDDQGFESELLKVADKINANIAFLKGLPANDIVNYVFRALMFATLCTKHPGFEEEKEWRLTYCPTYESTPNVSKVVELINGVPQIIYQIPLKDVPSAGLLGLDLDKLIKKIIIGPTNYSLAMYKSFVTLLTDAGVEDASTKVLISGIPLRN